LITFLITKPRMHVAPALHLVPDVGGRCEYTTGPTLGVHAAFVTDKFEWIQNRVFAGMHQHMQAKLLTLVRTHQKHAVLVREPSV